jgi:glutamine amidotransferase
MITIVDYGMGNLGSVKNMFKKIGQQTLITSEYKDVENATKILLPGVGSYDSAVKNLKKLNLFELLKKRVLEDNVPILGICLGMQLLTKGSQEGELEGLGFIDGFAKKFDFSNLEQKLPIPHMGWNRVNIKKDSKLIKENSQRENRFYFVHSYAIECKDKEDILTTTHYGYDFVSSFEKDNILGCQFHPEKSHKFGMSIFENFVENY